MKKAAFSFCLIYYLLNFITSVLSFFMFMDVILGDRRRPNHYIQNSSDTFFPEPCIGVCRSSSFLMCLQLISYCHCDYHFPALCIWPFTQYNYKIPFVLSQGKEENKVTPYIVMRLVYLQIIWQQQVKKIKIDLFGRHRNEKKKHCTKAKRHLVKDMGTCVCVVCIQNSNFCLSLDNIIYI